MPARSPHALALILLILLGLGLPAAAEAPPPQDPRSGFRAGESPGFDLELETFVYDAVRSAAEAQRLPRPVLDKLLARDPKSGNPLSFIPGCPICIPAMLALGDWMAEAPEEAAPGADLALLELLSQPKELGRTAALARWLKDQLAQALLARGGSEAEREAWQARIQAGVDEGQRQLRTWRARGERAYQLMWSCQLCDAARKASRP